MNTLQKDIDALNWSIVGPKLLAALKEVNNAFDKGRYDQFGRLKLTKAQGEGLWFSVSEAIRKAEHLDV